MLPRMDLVATSAGPWLVMGVVVGILLAGLVALAAVGLGRRSGPAPDPAPRPAPGSSPDPGWALDDLPAFLDHPPGTQPDRAAAVTEVGLSSGPAFSDAPGARRRPPVPLTARDDRTASRLLLALSAAAVLLVGAAAAVAALSGPSRGTASAAAPEPVGPDWAAPDVSGVPAQPSPGDPGAGRLAARSVPVGPDGALARATFEGLVLEHRAVGVTATYPSVGITAGEVPGGAALAHVRLPVWNCLSDSAPADPVTAGCRRLPTQYAELGTPALTVTSDGNGLRIDGRFPTYRRPAGSPPEWTGQAYRLSVTWTARGATVHLGDERAVALEDPRLTDLRVG